MGPLAGTKVVEIAGIGPGPFCGMMLADMGADILRVDRPGPPAPNARYDVLNRGKRSVVVDLKRPGAVAAMLALVERADVLTEGFRPGVMERLGLGPDICLQRNPRLVYGRMTGFGQEGPLSRAAGHDINYIALSGALSGIGRSGEPPVAPLNLVGDFGGGGMMLAFGIACALVETKRSGQGQIVDAAMVDGAATLAAFLFAGVQRGTWNPRRGANLIDGGAHFYDTYETKDGDYVAIGAIEPKFYSELLRLTGLDPVEFSGQMDQAQWPALKAKVGALFKTKTRSEWCELLEGSDACFAPVLSPLEAPDHPQNRARGTFIELDGVVQPGPTPRFSRTSPKADRRPPVPGEGGADALASWGLSREEIAQLAGSDDVTS